MKLPKEVIPYKRNVQFYETDAAGIAHHSNFIRWFEESRTSFLVDVGYPYQTISANGIHFVVLSISADYKHMVEFGDEITVTSYVKSISPARMIIGYTITKIDKTTGKEILCSTGESTHCSYNVKTQKLVSMKKELPELYEILDASRQ